MVVWSARVPIMSDGTSYDALHAEPATVDERLTAPEFLVGAAPEEVGALLDRASGSRALSAAAVYRASAHLHRDATADVRRQLLALDAARFGDRDLSARIIATPVAGAPAARWRVDWATGSRLDHRSGRAMTGHAGSVRSVASAVVDGRTVVVTSGDDGTVRVWDAVTGEQVGEPLIEHGSRVRAVATAVVDGRALAVSGGDDGTVRRWDLATGEQVGEPLVGMVRQFDLVTHKQIGWTKHGDGPGSEVRAVATTVVDGRPLAVGCTQWWVWVWDLVTGEQVGEPWWTERDDGLGWVWSMATTVVDGRPLAVTGSDDGTVRLWDVATGEQIGEPLVGAEWEGVAPGETGVATLVVDGRTLAISGGDDWAVRVWDVAAGEQVGEPLTGHDDRIWAGAALVVDGRTLAVTGSEDKTVRLWDLATREQVGSPLVFPLPVRALAVAPGGRLEVGFGSEVAALSWR
ncbi:WD40 repeat domain-containing protein [Kitasatospora sp. NPDC101155]|uniref:WD40 repeat domain-containing protein n=1 Tax=Kitasatospora sp. NPDC101155 TaxID=3364097 RepID=UPI0038167BB0